MTIFLIRLVTCKYSVGIVIFTRVLEDFSILNFHTLGKE